jgi:hypothetical protein
MFQCGAVTRVLIALGHILSVPKCHLRPSRVQRFLGLQVDTQLPGFRLPEDKAVAFAEFAAALAAKAHVSNRDIAKLAGKLSHSPQPSP